MPLSPRQMEQWLIGWRWGQLCAYRPTTQTIKRIAAELHRAIRQGDSPNLVLELQGERCYYLAALTLNTLVRKALTP